MNEMKAEKIVSSDIDWKAATDVFGDRVFQGGQTLVENKVLSDRRAEGGGIAYLVKFNPPSGALLKVVATARSDEHVYLLQGAYCNRAGESIAAPGAYGINAGGRQHSAFIGAETVALVVYRGEPDEVVQLEVVDPIKAKDKAKSRPEG
jgi:hypothetical protein